MTEAKPDPRCAPQLEASTTQEGPSPQREPGSTPVSEAPPERGFTLLEVMVALAILAVSFTALLGSQSSAVVLTRYVNGITVASLLARGKMLDIEHKMKKEGFDAFGEDRETGDFSDEGHPEFKWEALVEKIEMDEGSIQRLMESAPQSREDVLTRLTDNPQLQGMDLSGLNFDPGMIYGFVPTAIQMLGEKLRKCTLTVSWKDGRRVRKLQVQSYIVQHEQFQEPEKAAGAEGEGEGEGEKTPPSGGSSK